MRGRGSDADDPIDDAAPTTPEPERQESEGGQARDDGGRFVPAEKLVPESAASRREKQWQERVSAYVKPIEERLTGEVSSYKQQLEQERQARAEQAQALANLRGQIEAMQRQPAQRQEAQQGPDPDKLFAEADAALQANDYVTHKAKERAAYAAMADRRAADAVRVAREEWQRNQAPQMPLHIQQLMMQHPHVAAAQDKGTRMVRRIAEELEDEGMQPSPALLQKAFQLANEKLKPKAAPARPQFGQEGAAALAGIPTQRAGSGGTAAVTDGVKLTDAQWDAYQAGKKRGEWKSPDEYLKWADPHKHGLVK